MNNREQQIRNRAHALWEAEGRSHGRHEDHWRRAEQEIDRGNLGNLSSATPTAPQLQLEPTTLPDLAGGDDVDQGVPPGRMGMAANPKKLVEAADSGNPIHHTGKQPFDPLTE